MKDSLKTWGKIISQIFSYVTHNGSPITAKIIIPRQSQDSGLKYGGMDVKADLIFRGVICCVCEREREEGKRLNLS